MHTYTLYVSVHIMIVEINIAKSKCMYSYTYVCTHAMIVIPTHVMHCTCKCICMYVHVCMHTNGISCIRTYICASSYMHTRCMYYVCTHAMMVIPTHVMHCTCKCIRMYVYTWYIMYLHIHMCKFIHAYTLYVCAHTIIVIPTHVMHCTCKYICMHIYPSMQ